MKNADLPMTPTWCRNSDQQLYGLTKREYFAGLAMQGLAGSAAEYTRFSEMAADAVVIADALLSALEATK